MSTNRPASEYEAALLVVCSVICSVLIDFGADQETLVRRLREEHQRCVDRGRTNSAAIIEILVRSIDWHSSR